MRPDGDPITSDVVVIGGGGSGLAAALAAAQQGASVVVLEKAAAPGGTTALSVGSFAAAGTDIQRRAGIDDDPDAYLEDIERTLGDGYIPDNPELRRLLVSRSTETLSWLIGLGLIFHGPFPDPPQRVPRLHNVLPGSRAYIHTLARHCRRRGVRIMPATRARRLLSDDAAVVGVEAEGGGGMLTVLARRGVVLASGDLSAGEAFRRRYFPDLTAIDAINPGSTGDGHAMAQALGSSILNGEVMSGPIIRFPLPESRALAHGLPPTPLVGRLARAWLETMPSWLVRPAIVRFLTVMLAPSLALLDHGAALVDTAGDLAWPSDGTPASALAGTAGGDGYFIFDRRVATLFERPPHAISGGPGIAQAYLRDYRRYRPSLHHRADDLEALARRLGMDAAHLGAAVERHNRTAVDGGIGDAPLFGLGPVRPLMMVAEGSLPVTTELAVIDAQGRPIPHLFAAGSVGQGGMLLPAHGQHLAWAFTSGRIAGTSAARGGNNDGP